MSVVIPALYGFALLPYAASFGIAVYLFFAPCCDKLSWETFLELFQKVDPCLRVRAPLLSLAQIALTLPLLGFLREECTALPFCLTLTALLTAGITLVIAVRRSVPLSRRMDRWSAADPPADWQRVRDHWLRYHRWRGAAAIAGFVLLLAAAQIDSASRGRGPCPPGVPAEAAAEGPVPRRLEATVLLPLADNDGRPFAEAAWQEALDELVAPFGGATLGPPLEGCWLDARQRVCREPVRPIVVSFAPERLNEFRHAVHNVGKRLGQEAMYIRFEEPRIELLIVGAARPDLHGRAGCRPRPR
jgi:hypothetical protein